MLASLSFARSSTQQTARQGRTDIALQAADAGINEYESRLVEDPRYYDHWVDRAEDPRIDPYGAVHAPGTAWTPGVSWTYAGPLPDLDASSRTPASAPPPTRCASRPRRPAPTW